MPTLYTIGFTQKSLAEFIGALRAAGVTRVVDIRLKNTSQLAGFAKGRDLEFLLREGFGIGYCHEPELAPTEEILQAYQATEDWAAYEADFLALAEQRQIKRLGEQLLATGDTLCLLCSEAEADHCHRRLVAEYWAAQLPDITIEHL